MESPLKTQISDDMKAAMRARDKPRLGCIRLILAGIKQREVDERIELDDPQVLAVIDKMVKQRRDSIAQFGKAGRADLVAQEEYELTVIHEYMPEQMSSAEIAELMDQAIAETGAAGMKDMGKVMGYIKPRAQGRADMGQLSGMVREKLGS